ncbi:hypothetical protein [Leeuwenhoekiella marinoflava]|uniref:Uncharacterized protein n=2 Tax=Leeuwenhoekiella marinoflava TaxID=988 RepID=A0A4Q0PNC1_9FLAO|nr:hypothetical protein [Leeuwenhoekiella marinoflava]RXG32049.1 hypothetical protein DSL99_1354 [Leeuwenhoekiella marinoflava]SHE96141.1 hypothetical protein SAMN02745246_01409 [Leeuwenhoekiella marinoflava DSM 3653]
MKKTNLTVSELFGRLKELALESGSVYMDQIPEVLQDDFKLFISNRALTQGPNGREQIPSQDMREYYLKVHQGDGVSYPVQFKGGRMTREQAKNQYRSEVDRIIGKRPEYTNFSEGYQVYSDATTMFFDNFFQLNFQGWKNTPQEEIHEYNNERIAQEKRFYEFYKDLIDGLEE